MIIETHSDHVLNGVRRAVKNAVLAHDDVALHFFRPRHDAERDGVAQVQSPHLDSEGTVDDWPDGFFDQFDKDLNTSRAGAEMEFFANEMSIHRQFHDCRHFWGALRRLMGMRRVARRFDRDVYCHRAFLAKEPVPGIPMLQAAQPLAVDERRALMNWLTRGGPFWDDLHRHDPNEWLEC